MTDLNIGMWFVILLGGVTIIIFFWQYISKILKLGWLLVLQFAIGFVLLFLFNVFGQLINIYVPLNIITAFITGIFRIPGLIALIIIKIFII